MNETGIMRKFEDEVARYRKFQKGVLGAKNEYMIGNNEVDIKNYAKYLLAEGNATEKREILACLKSKLVFKDKMVQLVK